MSVSPLMCQAAAWRVKYMKMKSPGGEKVRARVENFGVHRKNRAGSYPTGIRCKELCQQVLTAGFWKEDFTHQIVAVEEMPLDEASGRGIDVLSGSAYNKAASLKDDLLKACFLEPRGNVMYSLLSHNHMALVILAILGKAKWDLPKLGTINFCDDGGRLSLDAIAATPNGKELMEVVIEGVECVVLSWKMDVEEPTAASVISAALNKCSDFAMRTTEWSALYTLRGGIIAASGPLAQRVAFASVVERARMELDSAAEDPDLDKLFDFLISIGVGVNTFFDDLANFQQVLINSKSRQLRFSAFGVVNKLPDKFPRVKIAVIKRAYWRKVPDVTNAWCNNPEAQWAAVAEHFLGYAEDLLLYVHQSDEINKQIEPETDKKDSQKRVCFYACVDIDVISALFDTVQAYKGKPPIDEVRKAMLNAATKHIQGIRYSINALPPKPLDFITWFAPKDLVDQAAVAAETTPQQAVASGEMQAAVNVLEFDKTTGQLVNTQVTFDNKNDVKKLPIELPWKDWYNEHLDLGMVLADKAAIVTMLESVHRQWDVSAIPVQMMSAVGKIYLVAGADMPAKSLMLPACVPKGCRVHDALNEHPMAVPVSVTLSNGTSEGATADTLGPPPTRAEYRLLPEFKVPTAVAVPTEGEGECIFQYSKDDSESMHPFWAVRRLTKIKLEDEQKAILAEIQRTGEKMKVPKVNCEIVTKVHPAMCIASIGDKAVSCTRFISVPFITNVTDVLKGEELICAHVLPIKPKKATKRTWQDEKKDHDKQVQKQAAVAAAKKLKMEK